MSALREVLKSLHAKENVPLATYSTLRVGGPARFLVELNSLDEIATLQLLCLEHQMPWHILSGGSNTLFSDEGFLGVVIKLSDNFDKIEHKNGELIVGASTSFAKLTKTALGMGWGKALGWCGTPGLLGGALRMNAGTRMGEIKDAVLSVTGVKDGELITFDRADIDYAYRRSSLPLDLIICEARLGVSKDGTEPLESLLPKVDEYRERRRKTQPAINSLGSFFKNPNPYFAGELIEKCQLKGLRYQGAQISPLHGNFIINADNAKALDILQIASIAQKTVFDNFGIMLEPEVRLVGNFSQNPLKF